MGRIINSKVSVQPVETIIEQNIETYLNDSTNTYAIFQTNTPILATYFSRNAYLSTYDVSLESYNEIVGSESPNKFHKIENFPLFDLDTSDFSTSITDNGIAGDITSTCLILPDTVRPLADDQIEIKWMSSKLLFTVTGATPDNINNKKYHRLSIKLSQYTIDEINLQVTKNLELDLNLIGKGNSSIVTKDFAKALSTIRTKYDNFLLSYMDKFYSKQHSCFINDNNSFIDQYLNLFIINNQLNTPFVQFRNSCIVNPIIKDKATMKTYRESFFYMLETTDFNNVENYLYSFTTVSDTRRYGFNYFTTKKLYFVEYANGAELLPNSYTIANEVFINNFNNDYSSINDLNLKFIIIFKDFLKNNYSSSHLELILQSLEELDDRFYDSNSSYKIFSDDYYLNAFIMFALKVLYHYFSNE